MNIALGIDTGGTYTDAVLVDQEDSVVLASAKALTTYHDLAVGISEAIAAVLADTASRIEPANIEMVSLSTTLATNAIVEGNGSPICLLLIGYDPQLIANYGFERELVTQNVRFIRGGHTVMGLEQLPLDEDAVLQAIEGFRDRVEAFAISGYFGVRNPEHELRAKQLVEEQTRGRDGRSLPVTCGHELSSRLNSVRRATTTALNARLIPLLTDLISTVRQTLDQAGISAPLMVVKGDGSLVRAGWAMQRPIETILSGPAASVVGASHLVGEKDVWVVDVGGTTTDIAGLEAGQPRINPQGAQVGRWQTMVEAVDVYTEGLGGDSMVRLNGAKPGESPFQIGPRRVVPLSVLAAHYPQILAALRAQVSEPKRYRYRGQFVLAQRFHTAGLSEYDRRFLKLLADGPRSMDELGSGSELGGLTLSRVERLAAQHIVQLAGFTPTDALHALGYFDRWNREAAQLGAKLYAGMLKLDVETFCQRVVGEVSERVGVALISKVLRDEAIAPAWEKEPIARAFIDRALHRTNDSALLCEMRLNRPVVAIGAPVAAYLPRTTELLHTDLLVPEHAEVANAMGAVAGSVVQRREIIIRPIDAIENPFRAYLPDGVRDFAKLEEAVTATRGIMDPFMVELARRAGAMQVEVKYKRTDVIAPLDEAFGDETWLETLLAFTAVGRPGLGR